MFRALGLCYYERREAAVHLIGLRMPGRPYVRRVGKVSFEDKKFLRGQADKS